VVAPFRPVVGDRLPVQQSSTTCGSASLTVARMLADPGFAAWIRTGARLDARGAETGLAGGAPTGSEVQRFGAYEQVVAARTNALFGGARRLQLPWPRALGTSPWGARNELEFGAAGPGSRYGIGWIRFRGADRLGQAYDELRARLRDGRPALLYVGSRWLPRHVVLVMPSTRGDELDVYEPAAGRVVDLGRAAFTGHRLGLGGWDVPWFVVQDRAASRPEDAT
jgi:hypothetical protein